MKRLMMFLGAILVASLGLLLFRKNFETAIAGNPDTIIVYNWGDYIDPELLKEFTKETGVQVQYNTFDFRNFENFKKQISTIHNIKKERTKFALSRF